MIDVKDRVIEFPKRYQLVLVAGETDVYDLVPVTGVVTEEGTPVNRELFLSIDEEEGMELNELNDLELRSEVFTNAGSDWNIHEFDYEFAGIPNVVVNPFDYDGIVQVRNVTKTSFEYRVRKFNNDNIYTGANNTATVTSVTKSVTVGWENDATAINISYIAIYDNGGTE